MRTTKPRILIVDDEPSSVELLCSLLAVHAELTIAGTGENALHMAEEWEPHLILLDIDLPDMSGFEVCQKLKTRLYGQNVPIIFLTGFTDFLFEARAFEAGAIDYITKPASPFRVMMRVNAHLPDDLKLPTEDIRDIAEDSAAGDR